MGLPPQRGFDHKIPLKVDTQLVNSKAYRYGPEQKDVIEEMVKEMLNNGVVRHSNSLYANPLYWLINKTSHGLCIDYKALNQIRITDKFPIPLIEELLEELGEATVLSKINFR